MTQALIFDAIRTPRGRGKADGALHSVKPVNLLAGLLGRCNSVPSSTPARSTTSCWGV